MDRETIDKIWQIALMQAVEDGEQYTRYHFAKLVAEHVIKSAPDYKMGYADGVATEREACAKVCDDIFRHWLQTESDEQFTIPDAYDCARAIRERSANAGARGNT